jgi:hypothetical protein
VLVAVLGSPSTRAFFLYVEPQVTEIQLKKILYLTSAIMFAAASAGVITLFLPKMVDSDAASAVRPTKSKRLLNVLDDSASILTSSEERSLFDGLADRSSDPAGAQIRKLVRSTKKEMVCGEINAKNQVGGYLGFVPFAAKVNVPRAGIGMFPREIVERLPEFVRDMQRQAGCPSS